MITIPRKYLKAAILAAGDSETRPHLCGVLIESRPGEVRVIGTDGSIISVSRITTDANEPHGRLVIPRQVVTDALAARGTTVATFEPSNGAWLLNGERAFNTLYDKYPDYRAGFTDRTSGEAAQLNPQLLAQFGKMARALGQPDSSVIVHYNGADNAMVTILGAPEFAGAIAPMRDVTRIGWPTAPHNWVRA